MTSIFKSIFSSPIAVIFLLLVSVFSLQLLFPIIESFLILDSSLAFFQPWRFFTAIFIHSGVAHLASNLIALIYFGFLLESIIEKKDFALVFLLGGLCSSLVSSIIYPYSLGASGAIYAIIGCLTVLRPFMYALAFSVPLPMILAGIIYLAVDLVGVFVPSNVAHFGHIFGFVFGAAFALIVLRRKYPEKIKSKNSTKISDDDFRAWEDKYMFKK